MHSHDHHEQKDGYLYKALREAPRRYQLYKPWDIYVNAALPHSVSCHPDVLSGMPSHSLAEQAQKM